MSDNPSNLKIKQLLEELGLYEPGMTIADMKTVYNTVNKSKQSASQENDFRQLMSQTDENSLNIHNLTQPSDGSSDTALEDKMGRSLIVSKEQKEEQLNSMETDAHSSDTDSIICTVSTPVVSSKRSNTHSNNDNIDVSMSAASVYKPLELRLPHKNRTVSAIFYHPTVLKLSVEKRARLIFQSNVIQIKKYQAIQRARRNIVTWGDPIKPTLARQFNGDLCVDAEPLVDEPEEILTGEVESGQSKKNNYCRSNEKNKPKRQVKRKNYKETESSDDDEDFVPNNNKKTKVNNGVVSRTGSRSNRNTVPKKLNLSLSTYNTPSRTDKIFDELKKLDKVTVSRQKSIQPALPGNCESSDEDIFPTERPSTTTTTIVVEVHGSNTSRQENQTATPRQNNVPEVEQQNASTKAMPAKNFYGRNRREKAPQMNNNNDVERKTECPICRLTFPMSVIENHAASCIQFEEEEEPSESVCDICRKRVPLTVDMYEHRQQCIKAICEQSVETTKCDTNDNKVGGGQMCSICDKYFMNSMDMNKHASECIRSIKHK